MTEATPTAAAAPSARASTPVSSSGAARSASTSNSPPPPVTSSRCSGRTARARPPRCARWPGSPRCPRAAGCGWTAPAGPYAAASPARSAWSSRTICSSRTCPRSTTSPSDRAARACPRRRPGPRPPRGWSAWASPTTPAPSRAGSPAARPSASPLARALATRPRLLLLDEPLAALDARTRLDVRAQLRHHLADFEAVAVLVTHDPLDAMVLADRLVVVEDGRVVQEGTPVGHRPQAAHRLHRPAGRPQPLPGRGRGPWTSAFSGRRPRVRAAALPAAGSGAVSRRALGRARADPVASVRLALSRRFARTATPRAGPGRGVCRARRRRHDDAGRATAARGAASAQHRPCRTGTPLQIHNDSGGEATLLIWALRPSAAGPRSWTTSSSYSPAGNLYDASGLKPAGGAPSTIVIASWGCST